MEAGLEKNTEQKFNSPEQELAYLREQVAIRERELGARGAEVKKDDIVSDAVRDYSYAPASSVLHESHQIPKSAVEVLALNLAPELHDVKITELASILQEKGIKNALSVAEAMN